MANPFSAFASIEGSYLQVEGAALKMHDYLGDFKKLRHTKLSTWTSDDADRIEIIRPGKSSLKAERNSGEWTQPGGRRFAQPVDSQIEAIFQLEIAAFEADGFGRGRYKIVAQSRSGEQLVLEVDEELRARASDRPGAVFKLHTGAEKVLSSSFGSSRR